jgi:DNA repair protein RecO (recombination protein O)
MASSAAAFGLALAGAHLRLLPERDPHARLYEALEFLVGHLDHPHLSGELMVRFELLLLDELGFGLDLEACAATGSRGDLAYVSPRSGRAVSRMAGEPYRERLLSLPAFLTGPGVGETDRNNLARGFQLTEIFLLRHVLEPRGLKMPDSRASFLKAIGIAVEVAA